MIASYPPLLLCEVDVMYLPSYDYPKKNTVSPAITIYNNV